jgi:integrase
MEASEYPYNLLWWVSCECGIRRGEVCGLDVGHIDLNNRTITVRRNRVGSVVKNTKSRRARVFRISPELAEQLNPLVEGRAADEPLFLSAEKVRLHPENLVKRELVPVLQGLGIHVKGTACHGFRHGNATEMDKLGVPMATRQQRLGHVDASTTMLYSHSTDANDSKVAEEFGRMLSQGFTQKAVATTSGD